MIGLGYVGLPVAVSFARSGVPVVGFDADPRRIAELKQGDDQTWELEVDELRHSPLLFTADRAELRRCDSMS